MSITRKLIGFERESYPDASSGAESGELPVRSKVAASMDLVDRSGHLSGAPPIEVYRLDSKGNWEYVTTIDRAPT